MRSADIPANAGAILTVDLDAVAANWRLLAARAAPGADCAAMVKADAYGLGAEAVGPALARAGAGVFFVATLDEGIRLRHVLTEEIGVLEGPRPGTEDELRQRKLTPVLNSLDQLQRWRTTGGGRAVLHLDTGMSRLGLSEGEVSTLASEPDRLRGVDLAWIMSHLVSGEVQHDPDNPAQLGRFRDALAKLPPAKASLANSAGIFLGPAYHFDLVRPGAALYGLAPVDHAPNPMRTTVRLEAEILQVREIPSGRSVGYNAQWRANRPTRIATVGIGYADGYLRSLTNRGHGYIAGRPIPLVGRVSMDLVTFDVTDVPEDTSRPGTPVVLMGPELPPDELGRLAGTNGYQMLTGLSRRYARRYLGTGA
ncbi:MAG: alanine racemase [Alphaproteobacteria bacterium]|nr:alanine racemase [Alphaproteobacteria bacterium]